MQAKIIFKNGTEITAEMNGNCYITLTKPAFPSDLSVVTVITDDGEMEYKNAELVECFSLDGRYWFAFNEISEAERAVRQMQANIEYIAMMTDVELEE